MGELLEDEVLRRMEEDMLEPDRVGTGERPLVEVVEVVAVDRRLEVEGGEGLPPADSGGKTVEEVVLVRL